MISEINKTETPKMQKVLLSKLGVLYIQVSLCISNHQITINTLLWEKLDFGEQLGKIVLRMLQFSGGEAAETQVCGTCV